MSNNKEILIIKDFGPIKSVELKLSRFNVFIGEQGTGKSTVAKVLAVCRYFSYIAMDDAFIAGQTKFSLGLASWGLGDAIKHNSYIYYECKHYSLTVTQNEQSIRDSFINDNGEYEIHSIFSFVPNCKPKSDEFINLLNEYQKIISQPRNGPVNPVNRILPTSFFLNDVAAVMENPFYIPTERGLQSIFSLGRSSIENISDSLFNQFARIDQVVRLFKDDTLIEPLGLVYKNVDGRGYIRKVNEDTFYSLYNAASGYQSTIPVVLLMEYYISIRKKAKTFIIEEPELNLFPSAQKELMQYLVDKTMNYGNTMLLTTHSPYVLTSLNNLIYAYQTGQTHKEKVNKIIEEKYWLNPSDVSVYRLLSGGTCENIVAEEGLIEAEKIDEVSRTINESFDALLNIELSTENETV